MRKRSNAKRLRQNEKQKEGQNENKIKKAKMGYDWGLRSKNRMKKVNPYLIECANLTIQQSIYDLTIPWMGGVRTAQDQNEIFKKGNSKCDGYDVLSYHQIEASNNGYGNALDIRPVGWNQMSAQDLYSRAIYIGRLMMINWQELIFINAQNCIDIGVMIWGGTFGSTSWDRPHFEIR